MRPIRSRDPAGRGRWFAVALGLLGLHCQGTVGTTSTSRGSGGGSGDTTGPGGAAAEPTTFASAHPGQVLISAMQAVGYTMDTFGEVSGRLAELFG